jgi:hypothetical protein
VWIIGPILGALALFFLLFLVPVHLVLSSDSSAGSTRTRIAVKWLFGLVRFRISPKRAEPKKSGKEARRPRMLAITLRTPGFGQRLLRLAEDLLRVTHFRRLRVDLRLGLSDPADTGMLAASVMPVMAFIGPFHGVELNVEPDFAQEGMQAQFNGEVKVYPIAFVMPVLRFAFSRPTLRVAKAAVMDEP